MIFVKILGIIDILAAILFWLFAFFGILPGLTLTLAIFLLLKGVIFMISLSVASIGDVVCSLIIFMAFVFTLPKIIIIVVSIYLLQKGAFSLL